MPPIRGIRGRMRIPARMCLRSIGLSVRRPPPIRTAKICISRSSRPATTTGRCRGICETFRRSLIPPPSMDGSPTRTWCCVMSNQNRRYCASSMITRRRGSGSFMFLCLTTHQALRPSVEWRGVLTRNLWEKAFGQAEPVPDPAALKSDEVHAVQIDSRSRDQKLGQIQPSGL